MVETSILIPVLVYFMSFVAVITPAKAQQLKISQDGLTVSFTELFIYVSFPFHFE